MLSALNLFFDNKFHSTRYIDRTIVNIMQLKKKKKCGCIKYLMSQDRLHRFLSNLCDCEDY